MAEDNTDVNLSSLNLTITLSFFGIFWSIASYILFTKWKCINDQTIWENQLLPILKPIWDNYGYPFFHTCCCALCLQKTEKNEKDSLIGSNRKPSQQGATLVDGINGATNRRQSSSSVVSTDEYQCVKSVENISGVNGYQSINGDNSPYDAKAADDAGQSVTGYQAIKIANDINDEEKALPPKEPDLTSVDYKYETLPPSDTDEPKNKEPLFKSSAVIFMFSLAQILARPFIIVVNIVYIAVNHQGIFSVANYTILQETITLVTGPISNAIYWVCCWRQCRTNNSCRKFLEFMRFSDLQIVLIMAPFSNIPLYVLGGWWYIVIIVRLTFYAVTFASCVVAGMRFVFACYCKILCTCGCDNDVLEIRNMNHLFLKIVFQLIPIFIKLNTSSAAIATYLTIGSHGGPSFRQGYLTFSLIRSFSSLFSLGFSGAMLRWAVLKEEHKWENRSWLTRWLRFLDKYQLHIHISFFFDMITYFPLILLNLILLDGIDEKCFYIPGLLTV